MDPFLERFDVECSTYRKCRRNSHGTFPKDIAEATADDQCERNSAADANNDGEKLSNNDVLGLAFYSFLGFTIVQTSYAIRANSSAMVADSSAMWVDAGTYLCNMLAERLKSRPLTLEEEMLRPSVLEYKLKLQRLYLELFPPLISVVTLLYVTCSTFDSAIGTVLGLSVPASSSSSEEDIINSEDEPNLRVMMVFSFMNLCLDIVNVTCFAKVHQAVMTPINFETKTEETHLLEYQYQLGETLSYTTQSSMEADDDDDDMSNDDELVNLNMCSAWTHVFADTIRSVAVLLAGAIAYFTGLISPSIADASAALVVSLVIFLSCIPLIRGLLKTFHEITIMRESALLMEI